MLATFGTKNTVVFFSYVELEVDSRVKSKRPTVTATGSSLAPSVRTGTGTFLKIGSRPNAPELQFLTLGDRLIVVRVAYQSFYNCIL